MSSWVVYSDGKGNSYIDTNWKINRNKAENKVSCLILELKLLTIRQRISPSDT